MQDLGLIQKSGFIVCWATLLVYQFSDSVIASVSYPLSVLSEFQKVI